MSNPYLDQQITSLSGHVLSSGISAAGERARSRSRESRVPVSRSGLWATRRLGSGMVSGVPEERAKSLIFVCRLLHVNLANLIRIFFRVNITCQDGCLRVSTPDFGPLHTTSRIKTIRGDPSNNGNVNVNLLVLGACYCGRPLAHVNRQRRLDRFLKCVRDLHNSKTRARKCIVTNALGVIVVEEPLS